MLRAAICSISLGIAGAVGFAFYFTWTHPSEPARNSWRAQRSVSAIQNWHPNGSVFRAAELARAPDGEGVRLASLETVSASNEHIAVFEKRFLNGEDFVSFNDRFGVTSVVGRAVNAVKTEPVDMKPRGAASKSASPAAGPLVPEVANAARSQFNNGTRAANARQASVAPPDQKNRTAFYDISAQVVYLPDGRKLEAHSGHGSHMDNARYVHIKNKGPTPPNIYRLALRENLFHGVQAIRLIPIGDGDMFGRDGILAHHYLLGPNGQSNGCVSFADYPQFLNAYLNGDIDRLVVVERLESPPSPMIAAAWFTTAIKGLLKPFERGSGT